MVASGRLTWRSLLGCRFSGGILGPTAHRLAFRRVPLLVTADALIDGSGSAPIRPGALLLEGDRIVGVGPHLAPPPNAERLHLAGASILPWLIGCHVHLSDEWLPYAGPPDPDPPALRVLPI